MGRGHGGPRGDRRLGEVQRHHGARLDTATLVGWLRCGGGDSGGELYNGDF